LRSMRSAWPSPGVIGGADTATTHPRCRRPADGHEPDRSGDNFFPQSIAASSAGALW
jgi:hypothetical protein